MPKTADSARKIVEKYFSGGDDDGEALIVDIAAALTAARDEALTEAKQCIGFCNCEITLDQDGVEHVLDEIGQKIEALKSAKQGGR